MGTQIHPPDPIPVEERGLTPWPPSDSLLLAPYGPRLLPARRAPSLRPWREREPPPSATTAQSSFRDLPALLGHGGSPPGQALSPPPRPPELLLRPAATCLRRAMARAWPAAPQMRARHPGQDSSSSAARRSADASAQPRQNSSSRTLLSHGGSPPGQALPLERHVSLSLPRPR